MQRALSIQEAAEWADTGNASPAAEASVCDIMDRTMKLELGPEYYGVCKANPVEHIALSVAASDPTDSRKPQPYYAPGSQRKYRIR